MVSYDPAVIQKVAGSLYSRASTITVLYGVAGVVGAWVLTALLMRGASPVLVVFGGGVGAAIGAGRAFTLRFQAQQLLCQLQIEANTRNTGAEPKAPPGY